MKESKYYLIIFSCFMIFMSCANQSRYINPEYKDMKIYNAVLLLPQFENSNFIKNENLFNELDIYYTKEEYYSYFVKNFELGINNQTVFKKIQYISADTPPEFITRNLTLNNDTQLTMNLPSKPLQLNIPDPVFILFLEDLTFTFTKKTKESTTSARSYDISGVREEDATLHPTKRFKYYIIINSKYAIYDNTTGDLVSYGQVSARERYIPPTPIEDLVKRDIKDFAKEIFMKTPFVM